MAFRHHPVDQIVNVHWGTSPTAVIDLTFRLQKPFGVGDWIGHLTMTTAVVGLPTLSQTSFSVIADSFLPGEEQEVSQEWPISGGKKISALANLSTVGDYGGGIRYTFPPASVPNLLELHLNGQAPEVVDRNLDPMNVPIDVFATGFDSMMPADNHYRTKHVVIGPSGSWSADLFIQIEPPSMSLS